MQPIELIHSVERTNVAKNVQSQHLNDAVKASEDAAKHIQDEVVLQKTSVTNTNKEEALDPDEKKKQLLQKRKDGKRDPNQKESGSPENPSSQSEDEDRGAILDLEA